MICFFAEYGLDKFVKVQRRPAAAKQQLSLKSKGKSEEGKAGKPSIAQQLGLAFGGKGSGTKVCPTVPQ